MLRAAKARQRPHQHSVLRSHPRPAAVHRRGQRLFPRHPRLLPGSRPQKVQAPRPRLPLQVPRLRHLPRLPPASGASALEARAVLINNPAKNICETSGSHDHRRPRSFSRQCTTLTVTATEIAGKVLEEVRQRIHSPPSGWPRLPHPRPPKLHPQRRRIQAPSSWPHPSARAWSVPSTSSSEPSHRPPHPRHRQAHPHHEGPPSRTSATPSSVVEHDPDVIRSADYLLDLGPRKWLELGGQLLASGTVAEVHRQPPTPSPANISPAASASLSPNTAASPAASTSSSPEPASTTFAASTSTSPSTSSAASPESAALANPRSSTRSSTAPSCSR